MLRSVAPAGVSLTLLLSATSPLPGQDTKAPAIDTARARRVFEEARALAREDGGRLWGVSLDGPLLLVEPTTRAAVATESGRGGELTGSGGLFTGTLPPALPPANTAIDWAGVHWTMVLWPLPDDPAARRQLLAHELWHRVQGRIGLPAGDPASPHLDTEEGRVLLRLEARALAAALEAGTPAASDRALADAAGFRHRRQARFPGAAASEAALEAHEGMAEYTGERLSGRNAAGQRAHAIGALGRLEQAETIGRSFAYATGPALGLLLDERRPAWRTEVVASRNPAALLYGALPAGHATRAAEEARYGGAAIRSEERERALRRARRHRELVGLFVEGAVVRIPLTNPRISFDPGRVETLDSAGTVYGAVRLTDVWGILDAAGSGGLINSTWTEARVPAGVGLDPAAPAGNGWRLELGRGYRLTRAPGGWVVEKPPPG